MIRVIIDNSTSQILGLTDAQFKEIRKILSYNTSPQANYFSKSWGSPIRYLIDKRGSFASGLLYLVEEYCSHLPADQIRYIDRRTKPKAQEGLFNMSLSLLPYPTQTNAAKAICERSRGIIVSPTGTGKSIIIALAINELKVPTLVVVPSLELKRQLSEVLSKIFSTKIGKGEKIWVENIDALDTNKVLKGYDFIILDEFHHSAAQTYRTLNKKTWTNIYLRLGLTATAFRSQDNERLLLESMLSEVIYKVDYQNAVKDKQIVPLEAYYVDLPITIPKGNQSSWPAMYSELVVNNQRRNAIIHELLVKLHVHYVSTLCLVKEIKHGQILTNDGDFLFANGESDDTKDLIAKFNKEEIKTLIGTTGVLGEGIDTKPAEYVIIAGLGKSKNAFMQNCGRVFRNYSGKETCKVIIFRDLSHKWTKAHFNAQVKYLKEEYGVIPIKLELD